MSSEIKNIYNLENSKGEKLWHVWNVEYSDDYNYGGYLWSRDEPTPEEIFALYSVLGVGEELAEQITKERAYFIERVYAEKITRKEIA